ncbi:protein YhfH [Virgibacillus ainsalahensis]
MMKMKERMMCPECGEQVDPQSYSMECDYCLSKKVD